MKEMRRILALVLCFVMLVGILPVSALATDTVPVETSVVETTEAPTNAVEDDDVADDDPEEVIDSNIVPADNTTAPADNALTKATLDANAGIALASNEDDGVATAANDPVVVIAGSDYQDSGSATAMKSIIGKMGYSSISGILMGGDYNGSAYSMTTAQNVVTVDNAITTAGVSTSAQRIYVQGNHDANLTPGSGNILTPTGAYDTDYYGVYAISYKDFGSASSGLQTYLDGKTGYTKPIFVITHQPLHTGRNDNNSAIDIFNALNAAGEKGLNIIFLFGHNHSGTYDDYLGGGAIYLKKGESMPVAGGSGSQTLNFTYMNCGYVGYSNSNACDHLTMTAFEIYEDEVIVKRYDASGLHMLKEKGTTNSTNNNANEYGYAVLNLSTGESTTYDLSADSGDDNTGSGDNSGTTGGSGNVYKLDTDGVSTGEDYLIVSAGADGTAYALRNNGGSIASAEVTISNGQIVTDAADIVWTYDNNTYLSNNGQYLYLTNGSLSISSARTMNISSNSAGDGAYTVKREEYNYYLSYDNGWEYSSSADDVYFFVRTSETGGSTGGGTTVTPSGGDWVTITTPVEASSRYKYELDTNGVDTGVEYLIVAESYEKALSAAASSNNSVDIEIEGNFAYADADTYGWTFTNYSTDVYYIRLNGSTYLTGGSSLGSSNSTGSSRRWDVSSNGDGSYDIDRNNYYLRWSNSNGYFQASNYNTDPVRLYKYIGQEDIAAQAGLYGKIDGNLEYTVPYGADENTVLGIVKESITILYHTGDASAAQTYPDDGEGMSWTLDPNYNGEVPGEYALTIKYNDVVLGTVKVIVPNVGIEADDILYYIDESLTAPINAGLVEGTTTGGTYAYEIVEGGDAIIDSIDADGTITFTGTEGTAQVKITYTYTEDGVASTLEKTINVTATEPYYTIDITDGENVVTDTTITEKGVTDTTTLQLGTEVAYFGPENSGTLEAIPEGATLEWSIPEEYQHIATVNQNGLVSFKGESGAFYVTATLTVDGKDYTAVVNISATTSQYSIPSDGTVDFPEYPNEGAIRFDKTATAVGNFSETGIAQVELSMTGVPYTKGSEIDVVLMLDRSRSMNKDRIDATVAATKAFIKGIVMNEDDSYNGNRIYVGYFMGSATYDITDSGNIGGTFTTIDNIDEYNALVRDIEKEYTQQSTNGGTDWQIALEDSEKLLEAAKTDGIGNNRPKFCVFMSDGEPSDYRDLQNNTYDHTSFNNPNWVTNNSRNSSYQYELYSTRMKGTKGITIYSVLLGETGTEPQFLMNDLSGAAGETTNDTGSAMSKKNKYYYNVPDADAAADMENVFKGIAVSILQAATNVTVEDKITDEYTMIFDIPEGTKDITGVTDDFYIEFGKYTLDANHERTEDGYTSVTKLYLQNTSGTLSTKDATAPVFEQKVIGEKGSVYYWTTNSSYASKAAVSYTTADTTYYFIPYGMEKNEDGTAPTGWYNMTSGAYANGKVDATTNMSNDLVIATPYFVYNASTRMLYWTVDKLDTTEYALRYFLYLDNSATEVGTNNEADPGSYPTNEHAYITYTNFRDNDCQQEFPVPQLTWSGAQVSYVFYLVNSAGQPINKSGQVVDFANATFVTDIYTENTVWNKGEDGKITADSKLGINWLAEELLPSDYKVYDENAQYQLHVYGNHDGSSNFDYFTIGGNNAATISESLNNRLEGANTSTDSVSLTTTKVYNTKAGQKITGYGTYTSEATDSISDEIILSGFDFYNTTVAFAVVWQPALVPDAVVVDYGLDVLINVVANDLMQNTVTGIGLGKEAYGSIAMNTGVSSTSELGTAALNVDGNTISIENENAVRFSQGDMLFQSPTVFYYESPVEFYENSNKTNGYMYSSVTVIPATTVYYEDDFVTLDSYTNNVKDSTSKWTTAGTVMGATQDQDRPGASQISAALDADNKYGHDSAYETMSQYSMGSAKKITVDAATRGEAAFTFYGTGFDVISMTSKDTGTLTVLVTDEKGNTVKSTIVDTYYGMNADGSISINNPDAIYQVPVIKISGLDYDKGPYSVKLTAGWNDFFDHVDGSTSYDLYLDAIRIYDPTGNNNTIANNAYTADGEAWPTYQELRNNIIAASNYSVTENADGTVTVSGTDLPGAIFIDCNDGTTSIADYVSYGPNNELYLAKDQAIAFKVTDADIADIQLGIKVANGDSVTYEINGDPYTVNTTTDMYYSILDYAKNSAVVTIKNVDGGILSLTNIKVTHTTAPAAASEISLLSMDAESAGVALMMLRKAPAVEEEVPETTVPEVTEPETSVPEETEPETEETKPGKPNKEDKPEKETKPNKPGKEDKDDKETKPTKPNKPNKPNNNDSAVVVHSYLNKLASAVKSFVTALLVRWF